MKPLTIAVLLTVLISPLPLSAEEPVEKAGVAVGVTAGNMWFVPIKAIEVFNGLTMGALSFVLSAGNADLTRQIWEDTTQGPYIITPELAKEAIGERPELEKE